MPQPPVLTAEQRREAYEKALALRLARADIKRWVGRPNHPQERFIARERFKLAWDFPAAQGMPVLDLLRAVPGIGEATARNLLAKAGIPEKNTVRRCGPKQRERLFHLLNA